MNGIIKKATEKQIVKNALAVEQSCNPQKLSKPVSDRRLRNLKSKLLSLLDGAKKHPEIQAALPNCEKFFKRLSTDEFIALLSDTEDYQDPIYIALYYHCAATMHKATKERALFTKERMVLLYPLWRFYVDEADTYI